MIKFREAADDISPGFMRVLVLDLVGFVSGAFWWFDAVCMGVGRRLTWAHNCHSIIAGHVLPGSVVSNTCTRI